MLENWLTTVCTSMDVDHVNLRRHLVDEGYLQRNRDGSCYRLSAKGPNQTMFSPAVDNVDVHRLISARKQSIAQKKRHLFSEQ